jgi:hypothetical protein
LTENSAKTCAALIKLPAAKSFLLADVVDDCTKQINHLLLNNPNLFNFLSRSPMLPIFYEGKALCAFARLKQNIVGSRKPSFPRNGFGKSCFVKDVVVCERCRKSQVVGCIWSATDELEVHIDFRLDQQGRKNFLLPRVRFYERTVFVWEFAASPLQTIHFLFFNLLLNNHTFYSTTGT